MSYANIDSILTNMPTKQESIQALVTRIEKFIEDK